MIGLVRAELLKVRTTQVWFWLLLGVIAVSALLVIAGLAPSDGIENAEDVPQLITSASTADLVVFTLGVLGVTTEFRYQTITATLLITPSRWTVVTAKMITYALLGVLYALVAVFTELVLTVPWVSAKGIDVDYGSSEMIHAVVGVFGVVALYGIVGLGIGALLRNQIVAVVVGLLFLLVIENITLAIPGVRSVWPYTPGGASAAILHITGSTNVADGVDLLGAGGGVIVLLLWAFIPAVLGAAITLNRDIT